MNRDEVSRCVNEQLGALRQMRLEKKITPAIFGMMVVRLSESYVDADMMDACMELLRTLPFEYYAEVQLGQMLANADYCAVACSVADAVAKALSTANQQSHFLMPRGEA